MNSKKTLLELEKEDSYVFHGSPYRIEVFEPRQAYTWENGEKIADGKPAVFASPCIDYAIFMAVINSVTCPNGYHSSCGFKNGTLVFKASKDTLAQVSSASSGFVYVFDKNMFVEKVPGEYVSYKKMKPSTCYQVSFADFDKSIEETVYEI